MRESRPIYRCRLKDEARARVMWNIYYSLATGAVEMRQCGRATLARAMARDARNLITLQCVRYDRRPMRRRLEEHK